MHVYGKCIYIHCKPSLYILTFKKYHVTCISTIFFLEYINILQDSNSSYKSKYRQLGHYLTTWTRMFTYFIEMSIFNPNKRYVRLMNTNLIFFTRGRSIENIEDWEMREIDKDEKSNYILQITLPKPVDNVCYMKL